MTISDDAFRAWLKSEETVKTVLVEAVYMERVPPGSEEPGVLGIELMGTHPFVSAPTDDPPNRAYRAFVKSVPAFAQTMADVMMGRTIANLGEVVVAVTEDQDHWIFDRDWIGRGLRLLVGDVAWPLADFRSVWTGVTSDLRANGTNELVFVARDRQHLLNEVVQVPLVVGSTTTGPQAAGSIPIPLVFGPAYNVTGVLVDATNHIYQFHDGPVVAITNVRHGLTSTGITYTTDLYNGQITVTSSSSLVGPVTADVTVSAIGSLAVDNAADLMRYFLTVRGPFGVDELDTDSFEALKALCPQKISYALDTKDVKIYEALDQIVNTVGAFYSVSREGKIFVKRFDFAGEPVMTLTEHDIAERGLQLQRILQPVSEIRIGAKKNNAVAVTAATYASFTGGPGEAGYAIAKREHHAVGAAVNDDAGLYAKKRAMPNPEPPTTNETEDPGILPSLFVSAADAAAEAARRMTLWGVPRYVFRLKCFVAPLQLELGDAVRISHPRYGFVTDQYPAGRTAVVIKLSERLSQKQVDLDVIL